jgi:ribosomal protein L22
VPKWGYSITEEELDPEKTVKASAREIRVSHKAAREVCRTIKEMPKTRDWTRTGCASSMQLQVKG